MSDELPCVLALPYLPLRDPVDFGGWWLGPLSSYVGAWRDAAFEGAVRRFLGGFQRPDGRPITNPALLVRGADGVDGVMPSPEEIAAHELAIAFATIDANPYWTPESRDSGWSVATADNADLWVQPLDPETGSVALGRGLRAQVLAGGFSVFDEGFAVPPPLELHMPFGLRLDAELLEAVYTTQLDACKRSSKTTAPVMGL